MMNMNIFQASDQDNHFANEFVQVCQMIIKVTIKTKGPQSHVLVDHNANFVRTDRPSCSRGIQAYPTGVSMPSFFLPDTVFPLALEPSQLTWKNLKNRWCLSFS